MKMSIDHSHLLRLLALPQSVCSILHLLQVPHPRQSLSSFLLAVLLLHLLVSLLMLVVVL